MDELLLELRDYLVFLNKDADFKKDHISFAATQYYLARLDQETKERWKNSIIQDRFSYNWTKGKLEKC